MTNIITVSKIGTGIEEIRNDELFFDPIRPDINTAQWKVISETDTTMTIQVLE